MGKNFRAAIVALGLRYWPGEGFRSLVLACDSEYVVKGVCEWMRTWKANGWKTSDGGDVLNRDLWETLGAKLEEWDDKGLWVRFWRVPRECNEADEVARKGAAMECENGGGDLGEVVALDI